MKSRALGICLVALFVAACASTTDTTTEPTSTPTADATVTPPASATATATASASPTAEPSEPAASGDECESEPPTSESDDWTERTGVTPDYRFSTPSEWVRRDGTTLQITTAVSPTTFDTIGFPDAAIMPVDLFAAPDGSGGVSAWVIESRIDTSTDELFDDELAWLEEQPQIVEVLDDSLERCIDGSTAQGFSSTWAFPDGDRYIEMYLLQRNGKVYETQITAQDEAGSETFAEVLRTWRWEEPLDGGGRADNGGFGDSGEVGAQLDDTDFDAAVLMTDFDQADWPGAPPPQSEAEESFDPDGRIWLVYKLDDGVSDTVLLTWYFEGQAATDASNLDYADGTAYAWGYLDPGSGGFDAGQWEAVLGLEEGGDRVTIQFEVTD